MLLEMEDIDAIIEQGNESALETFLSSASATFSFPELNCSDKRKKLWNALYEIASKNADKKKVLANCFCAIRILSREKAALDDLVNEQWMDLFKRYSGLLENNFNFTQENEDVAVEVSKCLCNLTFNSMVAATMCCKNGILDGIVERIKTYPDIKYPHNVKYFDLKLLFILTALCANIRQKLRIDKQVDDDLTKVLELILQEAADGKPQISLTDDQVDLACEVLKALFNLTLRVRQVDDEDLKKFNHLVIVLRKYLLIPTSNKEKSWLLQNNVINLLTNVPLKCYHLLIPVVDDTQTVPKKMQFQGHNMTAIYECLQFLKVKLDLEPGVKDQSEVLLPIITVLYKAALGERIIRKYLRLMILPPLKDVYNRPEQGTTLRNSLCRLLTTPITQLRDIIAELLFVLCKKSVKRMIKYTGYGNAAGLFAQKGLLGGQEDEGAAEFSSDDDDSETEEYAEAKHGINPVLGCFEPPHPDAMANMTEEQKEYEAMKLVQLMDSLTKSGAIKPCRVGQDGKPEPIEHVLQLQEGLRNQQVRQDSDSD